MFKRREKVKELVQVQLTCATCGKPIAGKARSDVTRYLFQESRCQCGKPSLVVKDKETAECPTALLPDNQVVAKEASIEAEPIAPEGSKEPPPWASALLANLPEQYEVLALIGEGGMGTVWKVRDKNLDKVFAIKVLRPWLVEDENALHRFEQEAQAASHLTHFNLAAVYNFGIGKQGAPYLVMDYLEGNDLAKIIQEEGCIDVPRALDLFIQIAEAVGHAHMKGVIHRDIKPTNIIVERNEQDVEIAKLVDFGIAKVLPNEGAATQAHTRTGEVFGSPPYMSPEQCLGNKLDACSDIYAFGCVMYESLCGKPPFAGENAIKTILKHIDAEPLPIAPASKEQKVPQDLEYVVMRCLEKSPADRYKSMLELEHDLRKIKAGTPIVRTLKKPKPEPVDVDLYRLYRRQSHTMKWLICYGITLGCVFAIPCVCTVGAIWNELCTPPYPSTKPLPGEASSNNVTVTVRMDKHLTEGVEQAGRSFLESNQYDKAIPLLEAAVRFYQESGNDNNASLLKDLQDLGKCYSRLGKYGIAVTYYAQALRIYDEDVAKEGVHFYQKGESNSARECVKSFVNILLKLNRDSEALMLKKKWHIK